MHVETFAPKPPGRTIAGVVHTPAWKQSTVVTVHLTETERLFLLYRLRDVTQVVEAILHPTAKGLHRPPFERKQLLTACWRLIDTLQNKPYLLIISKADRRLIVEAIEGNLFFRRPPDDPLVNAFNIKLADMLRQRLVVAMGCPIKRFKIGPLS